MSRPTDLEIDFDRLTRSRPRTSSLAEKCTRCQHVADCNPQILRTAITREAHGLPYNCEALRLCRLRQ
jgi:hypothetical protein